jgi:hypothetical protein
MPELASNKKQRVGNVWLRVYSYYILFLAAATSEFANTVEAQVIFLVFSGLLLSANNVGWPKDKFGFVLTACSVVITIFHYLTNGQLVVGEIKFFLIVLLIYYMVREFGLRLIEIVVDAIYKLTILSIPFYLLQLVNLDLFRAIFSNFNLSFPSQANEGGIYVGVFNLNPWALERNSGFMWEPGSFGAMLVFASVFGLVRDQFVMRKRSWLFLLVAITTFSTATYICIIALATMLLIQRNRRKIYKLVFALPLLILVTLKAYDLPFIGEKLRFYYENNLDYKSTYVSNDFTGGLSIGRFAGFMIELDKMINNPVVGTGWSTDYSDLGIGSDWSNPNGLGVLVGRFGLSGLILILYGLFNFCPRTRAPVITRLFVALVLMIPLFSNPFELNIVFWMMVMIGVNHKSILSLEVKSRHEKSNQLAVE